MYILVSERPMPMSAPVVLNESINIQLYRYLRQQGNHSFIASVVAECIAESMLARIGQPLHFNPAVGGFVE
jgi:hypothetical protein